MNFVCTACDLAADKGKIVIHGAREHNLKNICFEIPKGQLVALVGPSGSGKSTIAVEVLQKECLRQFLESLGMTTDHIAKPDVDLILGLSPSIGVSQRVTDFNPRSTVGTKTGISTILRNLFAVIGRQPCKGCGQLVKQPLQKKVEGSFFDCPHCGRQLEALKMAHFSTNATSGACEACKGLGEIIGVDLSKVINEERSLVEGGVSLWDEPVARHYEAVIQAAAKHYNFLFDTALPIKNYSAEQRNFLLYGVSFPDFAKAHKNYKEPKKVSEGKFEGVVPYLLNRYKSAPQSAIKQWFSHKSCEACGSARLGKLGREVRLCGKSIADASQLNLLELLEWIQNLQETCEETLVLERLLCALKERTANVIEVGLDYLTLDRTLPSLSAGESQRLKLACVLGSGLTGVLYVLDEPTTGLHSHDTAKLLKTLRRIQEAGNTVLIIEHDRDVIKWVDYIIEMGPGGGSQGGEIVATGTPQTVMATQKKVFIPESRIKAGKVLTVYGASEHNLKGVDVAIPVNQLVVLTGVSGSGKSTFLFGILDKAARRYFNGASEAPGKHVSIDGFNHFDRVVTVDQATIRKTQSSRSNVATYTKLFDSIRELFASLPAAKVRGFGADKFSFNASEMRCETCQGAGSVAVDMAFMPDVLLECPACRGMRFSEELLAVAFKGHHIADVLALTITEALTLFEGQKTIGPLLDLMRQVGLEYLTLGQSTATLSGGEAQRIKLAAELVKSGKGSTLYLLDEPTTGLHPNEVERVLDILRRLVSKGNSVLVIEHNLEVIAAADTIIDFGPRGGVFGGEVVATGPLHEIIENEASLTGQALREYFAPEFCCTRQSHGKCK